MAWYECRISEWYVEVIAQLFSGHQDKGLASIARQNAEIQQIFGCHSIFDGAANVISVVISIKFIASSDSITSILQDCSPSAIRRCF